VSSFVRNRTFGFGFSFGRKSSRLSVFGFGRKQCLKYRLTFGLGRKSKITFGRPLIYFLLSVNFSSLSRIVTIHMYNFCWCMLINIIIINTLTWPIVTNLFLHSRWSSSKKIIAKRTKEQFTASWHTICRLKPHQSKYFVYNSLCYIFIKHGCVHIKQYNIKTKEFYKCWCDNHTNVQYMAVLQNTI